jgi:hypothetical protein
MMNKPPDLTDILKDWEYEEDDNVRFLQAVDGRDLMQIRQPLGIEQYDLDGRPDGLKPAGEESFLNVYLKKEQASAATGKVLIIEDEDFLKLRDEGVLYYYRYLALFQVGHYDRVARDTEHNLKISKLLERCYKNDSQNELLQYRPYIRRLNAISKAMIHLADDETAMAMKELEKGRDEIEALSPVSTPIFEFEKIRSLEHLSQVISQVRNADSEVQGPLGFKERLGEELHKAVDNEDYERAARIRDRLNRLD